MVVEEAVICHMHVNQKEKRRYYVRERKKLDHEKSKTKINEISSVCQLPSKKNKAFEEFRPWGGVELKHGIIIDN